MKTLQVPNMHASTEQLLAYDNGEPLDADIRAHIESCSECADARARRQSVTRALQTLPAPPAPDVWQQVERRLDNSRAEPRRPRPLWPFGAAGAVVVAVAALMLVRPAPEPVPASVGVGAGVDVDVSPLFTPEPAPGKPAEIAELERRSQALERELRALAVRAPAVVRVGHAAQLEQIESRLRAIDYGMWRTPGRARSADLTEAYWQQRVRLLDSMVGIR